jgi:4-diphosphocytidyl-2-C-methyl-D-erythritol kinase
MEGGAARAGSREVSPVLEWYPAPAKLNLFLHVLGRRADGMHLLQTVFRFIAHADRVGLAVTGNGTIRRLTPLAGVTEESDLCVRAARLLKEATGARDGAEIALEKRLPIGGGLGGGSSDAATVLIVLNRLWKTGLSRESLMRLGEQLGADVPVFIFGESALGEGIGEQLRPLALAPAWYLVLTPQVAVSTKEIFSDAALTRDTEALKIPPFLPGQGRNDLEPVVTRRFPEVAAHLEWLRERNPGARMTGSGACVFAAFAGEAEARDLLACLPERMHGFVAQGLDSHPLRHLA